MRSLSIVVSTTLALVSLIPGVAAQQDCLRLLGSVACPGFQYAYLSPSNLSNAFPFFQDVTDVRSFDAAALDYFSNPYEFATTKFIDQLGCSNASTATIRYQRTVLCSMWVNEQWSSHCLAYYNGTSAATSQKMVCQSTCYDYSNSENQIVANQMYCPGGDNTGGTRQVQLLKDFSDCTNWATLATNNTETCVQGSANEDNCGYGSSTAQLCDFCRGDDPDDCCYQGSTDVSVCGFVLPSRAATTSSSASSTSGTSSQTSGSLQDSNNSSSSKKLSGGQIAGIVVGSVIGGLLLIAALILLALCCLRRKRSRNASRHPNTSEKGLIGATAAGHNSSPTMGGQTLYASSGHAAKSAESSLMTPRFGAGSAASGAAAGGFGAGMLGAGLAAGPGERVGGVVLPRVRDENQNGDVYIETGAEVTVLWPYQATLPDELDLRPGMKIRVLRLYDDAWGTGQVVGGDDGENARQGAFPIVCVSEGSSLGHSSGESSIASH